MNTSEFRIGNLMMDGLTGEILKVIDIDENNIGFYVINRDKFPLPNGWHAIPIAVTQEWLEKLGFSDKDYKIGFIGIEHKAGSVNTDFVLTKPMVIGEFQKEFIWQYNSGSLAKFNSLKYVHELQNLFFAITGEELKYSK